MQYIDIYDYLLLPVYLFLFYLLIKHKSLKLADLQLRKIFFIAFALRMFGSIAYSLLIQYYYGFGDAFGYYSGGSFIIGQIQNDTGNISYFFNSAEEMQRLYSLYDGQPPGLNGYIATPATLAVMKISALVSVLTFNKFLITSLFFALFSFAGQWKLFKVFNEINKGRNQKILAFAVLYTPSIWFWSSGLMKESICMGGLGFIISILYNAIVKKRTTFLDWVLLVLFVYIIYVIKSYIIIILLGALLLTILLFLFRLVKVFLLRVFLFIIAAAIIFLYFSLSGFTNQVSDLVTESVIQIESFQKAYLDLQEENSRAAFVMATFDASISSLLLRSPAVIFSCLFRPFLWESNKIIIVFSSIESTFLLLCTVFLLIKTKFWGFIKKIISNPFLFFCFTFSIILAALIGFTTFNFGTMTRYKIVLLPFYYFVLVFIYSNLMEKKKI